MGQASGSGIPNTGTYRWRIRDFASLCTDTKTVVVGEPFDLCGHRWDFELHPSGYDVPAREYVSLYLRLRDKQTTSPVRGAFRVAVWQNNRAVFSQGGPEEVVFSAEGRGWSRFQYQERTLSYLVDGVLTLELSVEITCTPRHKIQPPDVLWPTEQIFKLYSDQRFCDVTIHTGAAEFPAHRFVLVARSPVFAAMFSHEMKESLERKVVLDDLSSDLVSCLLRFIYTGECAPTKLVGDVPFWSQMMLCGKRFQMDDLVRLSASKLADLLHVETVTDCLLVAVKCDCAALVQVCTDFVKGGQLPDVLKTKAYKELDAEALRIVVASFAK